MQQGPLQQKPNALSYLDPMQKSYIRNVQYVILLFNMFPLCACLNVSLYDM